MIKQFFKFSTLSLLVLLVFTSCSDSDDSIAVIKDDFENGYFVSNEGNYGTPNASITFIDRNLTKPTKEVFKSVNGIALGDVFQSMTFSDEFAFLIINNSNKVEVVDRYTFESVATITDNIDKPRYAMIENGKLYVTSSSTKSVEIFDEKSFDHLATISINRTVEEIKEDNGFIYIMNASYGFGKDITVVDVDNHSIVKTITIGEGLNSMEIKDGILYALHKTGITKISTSNNESVGEITFEDGLKNAKKLQIADNFFYFFSGSKIFKSSIDVATLSNTELVDTNATGSTFDLGYGFNVVDDKIFFTNAKGFTENSEVSVYDLNGKLLKTFKAGIGANGVYGNN